MTTIKKNSFLTLIVLNSIYFFSYFHRVAVPGTIFNELQSSFSLSATAVAGLGALTILIYGTFQIFAGIISDRFGGFKTFLAGSILLSISSTLFSFAYTPAMLFITRGLVGFGASFIFISLVKILTNIYSPDDFPFFLSISIILGYLGGVVATYPLEKTISFMGWRNSFFIAGILCTIFSIIALQTFKKVQRSENLNRTFSFASFLQVIQNVSAIPVLISGSINFGIYFLLQSSLGKKFLQDSCNLTSEKASLFTFYMMVAITLSVFFSGHISRLLGKRKPILTTATFITLLGSAIIFLNLTFKGSSQIFLISYILLATSAAVSPIFLTVMKELYPENVSATSTGFLNTICYIGISLMGYLAGVVLDLFKHVSIEISGVIIYPDAAYRIIFLGCVMLALISFLVSFSIKETGKE
ncbi:MFS transporter [bacterium]|nr:MFS transporter [bacterium]